MIAKVYLDLGQESLIDIALEKAIVSVVLLLPYSSFIRKMKESNKKHFYVQTDKSLWVLRGSFRRMKHKDKEYTLIIVPKRRTLPKIPIVKRYIKISFVNVLLSLSIKFSFLIIL